MSKIITRDLANEEISKYLQNVAQASAAAAGITNDESKKYFTDTPKSFVFEKANLEQLWNLNPTADGLKVYQASHPDGTPTIVLVACKITEDAKGKVIRVDNLVANDTSSAVQWPTLTTINNSSNFDIEKDNG